MNYCLYLLLALFWSGSFLAIKLSLTHLPPGMAALLRVLIGQIVLTTVFFAMRQRLRLPFSSAWRLWVIGIFSQGLPFFLLFWGECSVAPALASILNSTVCAWTFLFSILIFRDFAHITWKKMTGLILGISGILVILLPLLIQRHDINKVEGVLTITGMAMSYAFGGLINQRFMTSDHKAPFKASLWHQHWGSLIFLIIVTRMIEPWPTLMPALSDPTSLLALLYLGIFSTAIAWLIYNHLIRDWGAVRASTCLLLIPLLAILWDYLFLHATPHWYEIVGVIFTLVGVSLIQFSKKRKIKNVLR